MDYIGFTPLLLAGYHGALAAFTMLTEAGSHLEARSHDKGSTRLHAAAAKDARK